MWRFDTGANGRAFVILLIVNVAFFLKSFSLDVVASNNLGDSTAKSYGALQDFYNMWGFQISDFGKGEFHSVFTNIFVHGGIMHIVGNMLAFWAFAIALEELFSGIGFLAFYIFCGVISCVSQGMFLTVLMYRSLEPVERWQG